MTRDDWHRLAPFDRALFMAVGVAWLGVGIFGNAPVLSDNVWMAVCAFPAGAALSMSHHLSLYALRSFVWASVAAAVARSVAYLVDGIIGPMFVWIIVTALIVLIRGRLVKIVE